MLLRVSFRSLSLLCGERCRRVELLLDARFSSERLLGLLRLRATAGRGRDRSFTEATGRDWQTGHQRQNDVFHLSTPVTRCCSS